MSKVFYAYVFSQDLEQNLGFIAQQNEEEALCAAHIEAFDLSLLECLSLQTNGSFKSHHITKRVQTILVYNALG